MFNKKPIGLGRQGLIEAAKCIQFTFPGLVEAVKCIQFTFQGPGSTA